MRPYHHSRKDFIMKKQTLTKVIASAVVLSSVATVSAFAGANLKEIKAYLDYDVKIKYDLEERSMLDANGARVYPISYNGEIYLPVTQLGEITDMNTKYDKTNNTVLLGITGEAVDFIDTYKPVYNSNMTYNKHCSSDMGRSVDIGSEKYDNYIMFRAWGNYNIGAYLSYDIGGKHSTLQFDIRSEASKDDSISILGDNDTLLYKIDMKRGDILKTVKIDVTGVSQIKIVNNQDTASNHNVYIVNAILQ